MDKRATIKDIAAQAGVSAGTVHRALTGKKGVGDALRKSILDIASASGYRANAAAAALKRGPLRIAAAFPAPDAENRYFYSYIWKGFRSHMAEMSDYNIDVIELPYGGASSQAAEINGALARYGKLDALITVGQTDPAGRAAMESCLKSGAAVFLVCDDIPELARAACVQADYDMTGSIAAELLCSQLNIGKVLLCAGDMLIPSHYRTVQGFENYIKSDGSRLETVKLYGYKNIEDTRLRLYEALEKGDIRGAFAVNARVSALLGNAIADLGLENSVRAIASDLFGESIQYLRDGTFKNIIFKDPYRQAYDAARLATSLLLKGEAPPAQVNFVESRVVFRSSLPMYIR